MIALRERTLLRQIAASLLIFMILGAVALFFIDQPLAIWLSRDELINFQLRSRDITNIALAEVWIGVVILSLIAYRFTRIRSFFTWAVQVTMALIISAIPLHLIKWVAGRKRPHLSNGFDHLDFSWFNQHWHYQSMPSGHTQVIMVVALISASVYPRAKYLIFISAIILAATRVTTLQHYLSDVVVGAWTGYLGVLLARYFWLRFDLNKYSAPAKF